MRGPASPTRRARRRRIALALTVAALGLPLALLPDDLPRRSSIALARLRGYDGCLCADCGQAFGFRGYTFRGCRGGGATGGELLATISGLASFIILFTAIDPSPAGSRFPPGHCPACGYDLAGCVLPVCPECGGKRGHA
jgi:hypothetical protein